LRIGFWDSPQSRVMIPSAHRAEGSDATEEAANDE
jgi:hypothetical protein